MSLAPGTRLGPYEILSAIGAGGMGVLVTFTPLQGMSAVVTSFLDPDNETARTFKMMIQAGWDDVPHLEPAEKAVLWLRFL
jgi:hypothetical protein